MILHTSEVAALCAAPWQHVPEYGRELARPLPLALLATAAVPPLVMAPSGLDYELRRFAQGSLGGSYNPEAISIWTPYVVIGASLGTWSLLVITDTCEGQRATSAIIQGIGATLLLVATTKWATGRQWPSGGRVPNSEDRLNYPQDAQSFSPFSTGLAAFPSGHTAVMFAAASALRASSPELGLWRYAGYPFALGVGLGMWFGDHHWASDIFSGALVGEALGASAGRNWASSQNQETTLTFLPLPTGAFASASGAF